MTDKNTGGPAFPCEGGQRVAVGNDLRKMLPSQGMSMRDYFAAKAMAGICAHRDNWGFPSSQAVAKEAYDIADAMLEARES